MADWYPPALLMPGNNSGLFIEGYARKGVLHTTEGDSVDLAIASYKKYNSWPHFTLSQEGEIHQHLTISISARALDHSDNIQTNRGGAIQIQVVGFELEPVWPSAQVEALYDLMRWLEANANIQPIGASFGSSEEAGSNNILEFTPSYWRTFNGWCGHQHVPDNLQWDPGAIDISILLPA